MSPGGPSSPAAISSTLGRIRRLSSPARLAHHAWDTVMILASDPPRTHEADPPEEVAACFFTSSSTVRSPNVSQ